MLEKYIHISKKKKKKKDKHPKTNKEIEKLD